MGSEELAIWQVKDLVGPGRRLPDLLWDTISEFEVVTAMPDNTTGLTAAPSKDLPDSSDVRGERHDDLLQSVSMGQGCDGHSIGVMVKAGVDVV